MVLWAFGVLLTPFHAGNRDSSPLGITNKKYKRTRSNRSLSFVLLEFRSPRHFP